jgi:hypothetical protein
VAIGASADAATHGTAPWLIAIVPLALALGAEPALGVPVTV